MRITIRYAKKVLPNRCRKERRLTVEETKDYELTQMTDEEFPVAFRVTQYDARTGKPVVTEIRQHTSMLFIATEQFTPNSELLFYNDHPVNAKYALPQRKDTMIPSKQLPEWQSYDEEYVEMRMRQHVIDWISGHPVFNGQLWEPSPEPGWRLLGNPWFSTEIESEAEISDRVEYNALELTQMLADAREKNPDVQVHPSKDCIEVLIPEAVIRPTHKERQRMKNLTYAIPKLHELNNMLEDPDLTASIAKLEAELKELTKPRHRTFASAV